MSSQGEELKLRIADTRPLPNYAHSSLQQARQHLTDGLLARYPIWTRAGGVTWDRATPVAISLEWKQRKPISGIVGIHVARGDYVGVAGPQQVDVFSRDSSGSFRFSNSRVLVTSDVPDRDLAWLDVEFTDASGGIIVVLHAGGNILSLDEIRVRRTSPASRAPARSNAVPLKSLASVRDASMQELRSGFRTRLPCAYPLAKPGSRPKGWDVALLKPYADLDPCAIRETSRLRRIAGFDFETESVVVRIDNGEDRERTFRLELKGVLEAEHRSGRLRSVVSSDGKLVLDAIEPMENKDLVLRPGEIAHLWVDLAMRALTPGSGELEFRLRELSGGKQRSLLIPTEVASAPIRREHQLEAVAWSTLSKPIWDDSSSALGELRAGGNTVFMIPPWYVPAVVDYADTPEGREKYVNFLAEFSQSGIVLVHLYALEELGGCRGSRAEAMGGRIKRLVSLANRAGVPYSRWAVYPTDEAHDGKLPELLACVRAIKAADSRVQIYANPTVSRDPAKALRTLKKMAPYVDIWQPRLRMVTGETLRFFRKQRHFWIYDNPRKPAKSETPLFYRSLPWVVVDLGATGVGFWSFDDTNKTSAWNDFDGKQPDWAVMYESASGPLPSRRWRAFRDGLEDAAVIRGLGSRAQAILSQPACKASLRFDPDRCRASLVRAARESPRD